MTFETSRLWRSTLATQDSDDYAAERDRLRSVFMRSRETARLLTDTISTSCPGLTLHNLDHLEAVWDSANLIVDDSNDLNPMEAFCLGLAILIHDAGHAIGAFAGGFDEIKTLDEWRDAVIDEFREQRNSRPTSLEIQNPPDPIRNAALFSTLRRVHGHVAERLALFEVTSSSGARSHFIQDDQLRAHFGKLIGLVAASHNWSLDDVRTRLPEQAGAISGFPREWSVDPIKLACILRCADATQIDQRRAPDFLFGILRIHGVSADHWFAQNRLALPVIDRSHPDTLVFTSTSPFPLDAAQAWWIAFELIQNADKELSSCHQLLIECGRSGLRLRSVAGARSPQALSSYVQTEGWRPVDANIRVSNAVNVALTLGGEQLYGNAPGVIFRELIQNASDAIRARKSLEPENRSLRSRLVIRVRREAACHSFEIEDNGVGMSQRVLTGTLIDFGSSLWNGQLVDREFPGLKSSNFRSAGRFGIGFFSLFMAAYDVSVVSRRFDAAHNQGHELRFPESLSSRPILLECDKATFARGFSTSVRFKMKNEVVERVLAAPPLRFIDDYSRPRLDALPIDLKDFIGRLCPMLDCDIFVSIDAEQEVQVHSEDWMNEPGEKWLRRVYGPIEKGSLVEATVIEAATRLSTIEADGRIVGRCALSVSEKLIGRRMTVSGLSTDDRPFWSRLYKTDNFWLYLIGAIDSEPRTARRDASEPRITSEGLLQWIGDQLNIGKQQSNCPISLNFMNSITAAWTGRYVEESFSFVYQLPGGRDLRSMPLIELAAKLDNGYCIIIGVDKTGERPELTAFVEEVEFVRLAEQKIKLEGAFMAAPRIRDNQFPKLDDSPLDMRESDSYLGIILSVLSRGRTLRCLPLTKKSSYIEDRHAIALYCARFSVE